MSKNTPTNLLKPIGEPGPKFLFCPEVTTTTTLDRAVPGWVAANEIGLTGCELVLQSLPDPTPTTLVGIAYWHTKLPISHQEGKAKNPHQSVLEPEERTFIRT